MRDAADLDQYMEEAESWAERVESEEVKPVTQPQPARPAPERRKYNELFAENRKRDNGMKLDSVKPSANEPIQFTEEDIIDEKDLFATFQGIGAVLDVFLANRKTKSGHRFGFIRFKGVKNPDGVVAQLNQIWFGTYKLRANRAKYQKRSVGKEAGPLLNPHKPIKSGGASLQKPLGSGRGITWKEGREELR